MSNIQITSRIIPASYKGTWKSATGCSDANFTGENFPNAGELIYDDSNTHSTLKKGNTNSSYFEDPENLSIYHSQFSDNAISANQLGVLTRGSAT